MKIIDILQSGRPSLSFEVFPPKNSTAFESVRTATEEIAKLHPSFMSVTYGAGGGTSEKPVGTIYLGCVFDGVYHGRELRTRNVSRAWNRHYAVLCMFDMIRKILDDGESGQNKRQDAEK